MVAAKQRAVAGGGETAVIPVRDVVRFAPRCGDGAVREGAALVTRNQRQSLRCGEKPGFTSEVQNFTLGPKERGDDIRVAGNFAKCCC